MKKGLFFAIITASVLLVCNSLQAQQFQLNIDTEITKKIFKKGSVTIETLNGSGDYTLFLANDIPENDQDIIQKIEFQGSYYTIRNLKINTYYLFIKDNKTGIIEGEYIKFE